MTERDKAFLAAVGAGRVKHIHPFTWVLPLELRDFRAGYRTLEKLRFAGFIKVDAGSSEYHRPVTLTDKARPHVPPTVLSADP